ncbi:MAG: hypothetical protein PWP12_598 [Bacillota bacterium]|jgi:uncharacterized membrane protein (DUF441 family)|nr:hypothetical protein [Bacillota bacterium]MDK2881831.1 hypothetical protein [Bacillota bacterium]MDK2960414.1 hypothetical protein [Bacillota bacterium]
MRDGIIMVFLIMAAALATGNKILGGAAAFVLALAVLPGQEGISFLCRHGIFLGLFFLTTAVLAPLVRGDLRFADVVATLLSPLGLVAVLGGTMSSIMNHKGVDLLQLEPRVAAGVVLGSLVSIAFFGGIPVGPVMAAGLTAVLLDVLRALGII